jgi:hypothetical protein
MLKNKLYRTLLVAGITGSLLISTGVVAFASSSKSNTKPNTKIGDVQRVNPLVSVLKTQVTSGVITQAESDAITSFLTTNEAAAKVKRAAEKTQLDTMTDGEKQTYMKANKPVRENLIDQLVAAKLLTQDQATKIEAAMPQRPEGKKGPGNKFGRSQQGMHKGDFLVDMLSKQVTAGVITQAKSDEVSAFLKTKEEAIKTEMTAQKATREAEKAKIEAMTDTQRETYMKANRPALKENMFTELVTAGILSQDQVDKIQASMPQKSQMGNKHGEKPAGAPTNNATDTIE